MGPYALVLFIPMQATATLPPPAAPPPSQPTSTWGGTGNARTTTPTSEPERGARVLHLDDATQIALRRQPQIVQARAATEAQVGRTEQARAPMLPQVTGTAIYNHAYGILATAGTTTATAPPGNGQYDRFTFAATATQLLWDFGQNYERFRSADRQIDAFRESEHAVELNVLINVRRAFFTARADKALIKVADETLANNERHLKQVEGFVLAGTHPEIDLAQAKSDIANARVQLINAQNAYDIAKAQLAQAMGGAVGEFDVADEELRAIDGEDQPIDSLVHRAMATRPELLSLERQRESNELTVKSLKGGYLPVLSAQAGASTSGLGLDVLQPAWNVGATASWAAFQGGLTHGQVHEAEANLGATDAQLEGERLQVRFDVENAVLLVRGAKATIGAAEDALTNARERLRLAEGRYREGVGSIIELGDAQVALTNASATVVQAQFNLSTARAQLLSALGRR